VSLNAPTKACTDLERAWLRTRRKESFVGDPARTSGLKRGAEVAQNCPGSYRPGSRHRPRREEGEGRLPLEMGAKDSSPTTQREYFRRTAGPNWEGWQEKDGEPLTSSPPEGRGFPTLNYRVGSVTTLRMCIHPGQRFLLHGTA
jgi:hypothetical protein